MSARMRVNRSHTGNRRSHHALKEPRLSTCSKCNAQHLRHRMCPECGNYRGREVVDVAGKKADRIIRRNEKLKEMGDEATEKEDGSRTHESAQVKEVKVVAKKDVKRAERKTTNSVNKKI